MFGNDAGHQRKRKEHSYEIQKSSGGGHRLVSVLAAVATCLSMAACGNQSGRSAGGNTTITIFNGATGTINENFNPFSPTALQPTLGIIYEPLYYYNVAKNAKPRPMLATGYKWNRDGDRLTITTRKGVKWTDGKPFTAADVAKTFNIIHDTPALNTSGLSASAKTIDSNHVAILFPKKNSFIQQDSILGNQAIVPEHIWKNVKNATSFVNSHPVGTGSFKLQKFNNQAYTLTANENYWGGAPKIKQVRYISLADADGATSALLAGKVDWMSAFIPNLKKILAGHKNISYTNSPNLTTAIFTCSNAKLGCTGPQTDVAVRQAMYYAMDRTRLNNLAGSGYGKMGSPTLLNPASQANWVVDKKNLYTPAKANVARANQILDAAGWKMGSNGVREKNGQPLRMTIQTVSGWSDYISINDILRQEFKKIGIDLQTTQMAWNEWNQKEQSGKFELSLDSFGVGVSTDPYFQYSGKYETANTVKVGQLATSGNIARYSNPAVDQAMDVAEHTNDTALKRSSYGKVQEQIVKDVPYIPIYVNSMLTEFNNSKVTGWPSDSDLYCMPASWKSWDSAEVLKRLVPKK